MTGDICKQILPLPSVTLEKKKSDYVKDASKQQRICIVFIKSLYAKNQMNYNSKHKFK